MAQQLEFNEKRRIAAGFSLKPWEAEGETGEKNNLRLAKLQEANIEFCWGHV